MNSIEPFLETIKLQQLLENFYEKIDLDKEILLVFTYLKKEEKYLGSMESLEPLFRRYSLGFERCIRIWRRKCSADSLLLANDRINIANRNEQRTGNNNDIRTNTSQPIQQLYIMDYENSNQLDRIQASFASSAQAAANLPTPSHSNDHNEDLVLNSNISISNSINNIINSNGNVSAKNRLFSGLQFILVLIKNI